MKDIIGTYRVLAKPNPFKDEVLETVVGAKLSLREILGNDSNDYIISLNGDIVKPEQWALVYPHADDLVVITRLPKGDGRDVLRLIAAIAVIAFAAWAGPLIAAALPGSAAFWTSATMFFGMVAIGLLLPPTMPDTSLDETKRLNSLTGSRNRFAPFAPLPNVYGRHRLYPPIASLPYTEVIGEDQYLNMIFCVGLGDYQIDAASVKIGDTPATSFEDLEITQTDQPTQPDIFELQQNLVLGQPAEPGDTFTRTSAANTEDISLDFVFPAGLIQVDPDDGDRHYIRLHFSVEYRASGSADPWVSITTRAWNLRTRGIRQTLGTNNDDWPVELTTSAGAIRVSNLNSSWLMVEARTRDPFRVGVKFDTGSPGTWDVRVTRQASQLDTRATRTEADETWEEFSSTFVWTALRSINYSAPAIALPPNIATFLVLRVRATDQLNGVIDSLNCIAQRKLRSWNKVGQTFNAPAITRDPAWAYLDILTGLGNARPIASGDEINKIHLDDLADWATANAAEGFFYDEVIDYSTSVFDALNRACGVGRAALSNRDGKWTVILEKAGGSPVQLFTPRNSWDFSGSKRFVNFPHALRIRFNSEDSDYQEDEMIVYDDGFNSGNATEFEVMELPGVTDSDQAWKVGRYTIASIRLRPEIYTFYTDFEHIVAQRGDHILMTHDIPLWGTGFGRIIDISGNVVTLDSEMFIDIGNSYRMRVRLNDGTTVIEDLVVQGGDVVTHTFTPAIPAGIGVGDLAIVGQLNQETQELVVVAIEPESDLAAKITCVDHNDAILTADTGPIPPFNPNITLPPDPKTMTPLPPFNVQASSTQLNFPTDGNSVIQQRIVVTWDINSQAVNRWSSLTADLRWREWDVTLNGGTWNYIRSFNAFQAFINIDNVDIGNDYEIQMRTVSPFGTPSPWTTSIIHTVGGGTRLPPAVDGLTTISDFGAVIVQVDFTTLLMRQGAYLEIVHALVNNRADASAVTVIKTVPNDITNLTIVDYLIPFLDTNERFFWARLVDIYGTASEYFPVSPTAGVSGTPLQSTSQFYYIKPVDGTAIKNSTGQLTVEARVVNGASDTLLSTGTIQLYDPSNLLVTAANGYVVGSDGYTGILDAGDINNSKTITLKDGPAGPPIDTITLVDILDGAAGLDGAYAYIEADPGIAWTRDIDGVTWSPTNTSTQLNVTVVRGGSEIARWARVVNRSADGILTDGGAGTHPGGNLGTANITPSITGASTRALTVAFAFDDGTSTVTVAETVVTARSGEQPLVYYIKPVAGTAIKNSTGQLTLEARLIDDTGDNLLSSGTIQLFDPSNNIVNVANGYVTGSDGYTGILDAGDILGDKVITLKDGPAGTPLDTITVVDITDGVDSLVGYIEASNGLAWVRNGTTLEWTPTGTTTDLDCTFNQAGVDVARVSYRITLNTSTGLLTGSTTTHPLGDLNTGRVTVTPSGSGTNTMTVKFDYSFGGFTGSVSETVGSVLPQGEIPMVGDPNIERGASVWDNIAGSVVYRTGEGTNGTDAISMTPSGGTGGADEFWYGERRGPDIFDVKSTGKFAVTVNYRVQLRTQSLATFWSGAPWPMIRISDSAGANVESYFGKPAQLNKTFNQSDTVGIWYDESVTIEIDDTGAAGNLPRYISVGMFAAATLAGPEYMIDSIQGVFSPQVFQGTEGIGLVPNPVTSTGKFLKDDGTWADAGGGGGIADGTVTGSVLYWSGTAWVEETAITRQPGPRLDIVGSSNAILRLRATNGGANQEITDIRATGTAAFVVMAVTDGGLNAQTLMSADRQDADAWDPLTINTEVRITDDSSALYTYLRFDDVLDYGEMGVAGGGNGIKFQGAGGKHYLAEQSVSPTAQTAYGVVWVKNDAPNTLWFTDDTGVDHQLGASAGETIPPGAVQDSSLRWNGTAWQEESSFLIDAVGSISSSVSSAALTVQAEFINTNDSGGTELRVRGNGQGDGYLYVGQNELIGGGLAYRGDATSPKAMTGATTDKVSFYRRNAGVDEVVFSYAYNSNVVDFRGNVDFGSGIDVTGNITVTGTVDGRNVATDGSKLDGIEAGATADQTITAGTGLTGGGTGNVTLSVNPDEISRQKGFGRWNYSTSTASPPSSGELRFNNATPTSATLMRVHETNADSVAVLNVLEQQDQIGATWFIYDMDNANNYWIVETSSRTDNGTWREYGIQYIVQGGAEPSNGASLGITVVSPNTVPSATLEDVAISWNPLSGRFEECNAGGDVFITMARDTARIRCGNLDVYNNAPGMSVRELDQGTNGKELTFAQLSGIGSIHTVQDNNTFGEYVMNWTRSGTAVGTITLHGDNIVLEPDNGSVTIPAALTSTSSTIDIKSSGVTDFLTITNTNTQQQLSCPSGNNIRLAAGTTPGVYVDSSSTSLYAAGVSVLTTQTATATGNTSGATLRAHDNTFRDIGFNTLNLESQNVSVTLAAQHCGALIYFNDGVAGRTVSTPASTSSDFPTYGVCTIINHADTTRSILTGSGATNIWLDGTSGAKTGTRTLARGMAVIWKISSSAYFIWGIGIS